MNHGLQLPPGYEIGPMSLAEVDVLEHWAIDEGWNPGIGDVAIARAYDPAAFIALRSGPQLVGGGAILAHGRSAGFMGLFIVRPDHRGRGLGRVLWHERLRRLRERLEPVAPIQMDGVFAMAPFYAAGGFKLLHRDLRFQGVADGEVDPDVVELGRFAPDYAREYDRRVMGIDRPAFIEQWLARPDCRVVALSTPAGPVGLACLRPAVTGYKFGPVYAPDAAVALRLIRALCAGVRGQTVQLDVPEVNAAGVGLAVALGLNEVFGCARMVFGEAPAARYAQIFGLTSFEFG